jgi:glycosyltransferase involved in cell wall biosynthesis
LTIAFDCSAGVREVIGQDEGCGVLIPAFDEDKYAEELVKLAHMSKEEQYVLRMNSVNRRSRFAPEIISEKWRKLFEELCNEKIR